MHWLPIRNEVKKSWPLEFPPWLMRLFAEYLRRMEELRIAKLRETAWLIMLIVCSVFALISPWFEGGIGASIISLILVYVSFRKYTQISAQVERAYVNCNVLYHHLQGKLEVGFCGHAQDCNCSEKFRRFVWRKYHISLSGGTAKCC